MGIQCSLLQYHDNICLCDTIANKLYAHMAGWNWGLHRLHSVCQLVWWGHFRNGIVLWHSIWKTFRKVLPTRFYQTWRKFLWIHFASCNFNVPHIFLLYDELLDDRHLPSYDSRCQWCIFNYSTSIQRL